MAEDVSVPDQPDGIESDTFDLPAVDAARGRVESFLEWYGDGRIVTDCEGSNAPAPLYARDVQALVNAAWERKQLLWLHAEAVWHRDEHEKTMREFASGGVSRIADYLTAQLEASRVECQRLRREVEFEANGATTFSGADRLYSEAREESEECSGRVVSGQASREEAAEQTVGTGYPQGSGPGHGSATPAPLSSQSGSVFPEGGTPTGGGE